jgi:hypothetical protein
MTAYAGEFIASSMVVYGGIRHGRGRIAEVIRPSQIRSSLVYQMRGYDTTEATTVFWASDHVDATAADYSGPGPVTDIVVQNIKQGA